MADMKKLTIARGGIHHRLTNIKKFVIEKFVPAEIKEVEDLYIRLENLEVCKKEYGEIQCEILCKIDKAENQDEWLKQIQKGDDFEELYFEVNAMLKKNINSLVVVKSNDKEVASGTGSMMNHAVNLPAITLPTFDGSYEKWINFQDTFQSVIHDSVHISTIEKFHYLKSSVSGEALSLIQTIEVSIDNYEIAWALLKERFTNKKLLIKKHIQSLFDLVTVQKESSSCLRKLLISTTTNLRILKKLGQPTEHWDALVIHFVTSKFDQ